MRFHLTRDARTPSPPLLAILGGTGTGKSTLVNRMLDATITATSFRRTFTAGAVAIAARHSDSPPAHWLGLDHERIDRDHLPARGEPESLAVVADDHPLLQHVTLVDTPDLDGDQPAHHVQADRAFRWADAVLFLVTPEKYQMTELLPYYRLARRYALPAIYVMNKCEEQAVADDFASQVEAHPFVIPRDDSAYQAPPDASLDALRVAIERIELPTADERGDGISNRAGDLLDRVRDQVIAPLRDARRQVDGIVASLRAMEAPRPTSM